LTIKKDYITFKTKWHKNYGIDNINSNLRHPEELEGSCLCTIISLRKDVSTPLRYAQHDAFAIQFNNECHKYNIIYRYTIIITKVKNNSLYKSDIFGENKKIIIIIMITFIYLVTKNEIKS